MEISIINSLKHRKSKSKSKNEENKIILEKEEDAPIKLKDVDINKTVKELKNYIYNSLNLSSQISLNRLGIMIATKKESKEVKTFLSDDYQKLIFYDGVSDPNTIYYLKDIGPQINYRLVYILEYLGPLVFSIIFFARYALIYMKNNPDKQLQTHILCYFFMTLFHYSKRIIESLFVHIFSRTTMPLQNLFKNCAYYWGIFGILCGYTLFNPYSKDLTWFKVPRYFFIAFFFSAEIKNLQTHIILREVKIKGKGKKYMPPKREGFELCTCANYMWEFFAWVSFSIFSCNIFVIIFTICGFLQMKQWALKKHKEMKRVFGEKYSKDIYAFIPYYI
jgi:very-long-chain enoyl-CoA reductase